MVSRAKTAGIILSCIVLVGAFLPGAQILRAAEPSAAAPAATPAAPPPEIQFKVLDEPLKMVPGAKPPGDLAEQRFVAVVHYEIPAPHRGAGLSGSRFELNMVLASLPEDSPPSKELREGLQKAYGKSVMSAIDGEAIDVIGQEFGPWTSVAKIPFFPAGVKAPPADAARAAYFAVRGPQSHTQDFYVVAPSKERAEEMARSLVTTLSLHASPGRHNAEAAVRRADDAVHKRAEEIVPLKKAQEEAEAQLSKLEPVSDHALEELRVRDLLIEAELAGAEGKLNAAKRRAPTTPQQDAVVFQAQIEQAGLLAQKEKIKQLLKQGGDYMAARKKAEDAAKTREAAEDIKGKAEQELTQNRQRLESELPVLCAQPVVIRPIEWAKVMGK